MTTDEAVVLAKDAQKAGADGLLLAPVSYLPLTEEEVFCHFKAVSAASDLPLCIYNNPTTTRFSFNHALIARIAALGTVAAIKMPLPADGDFRSEIAALCALTPDNFTIGYSGDWGACDALLEGSDSWFSVVAGLLPAPALALVRAAQSANERPAREIDDAFSSLWALFKTHGSFRVMYAMAHVLGIAKLAPPRPILPLDTSLHETVAKTLHDIELVSQRILPTTANP